MPGVQNLIELIDVGLGISQAIVLSYKDGKLDTADIPNLFPPLLALPAAIDGIDQVTVEIKDMDFEEAQYIKAHIIEKLPDLEQKWVEVAQEALNIALAAYRLVQLFSKPATNP